REVGEGLHDGDAGIVDREVRPLRGDLLDAFAGAGHEVREAAIVQIGHGDTHTAPPDSTGRAMAISSSSWVVRTRYFSRTSRTSGSSAERAAPREKTVMRRSHCSTALAT